MDNAALHKKSIRKKVAEDKSGISDAYIF